MTGLLLVTLLNLAPGIRLADTSASRHVAMSDEHHTPPFHSKADELPPDVIEELNVAQLRGALLILDAARPTYLVSGLLFSLGLFVGIPVAAIAYATFGAVSASGNILSGIFTYFVAALMGAVAIAGGIVALVGATLIVVRWFQRSRYMEVEDRVRARVRLLESETPPPALLHEEPALPTQVNFVVPGVMQTLMTF